MKLVLVLPKYSVPINEPCCFPLGFMSISAVLKQMGHQVTVLNFNLQEHDLESELVGADAALFTGFPAFAEFNCIVAAWCRERGIHTVLGGALATFAAEEMSRCFDAVVVGEGELVMEQALSSKGIIQGLKPDLDALPLPDYNGFGIDRYNELHSIRYMGVLTSRGCPYSCRFCAQTCSSQFRRLTAVFEEIDGYRANYGATHIVFNDNTLNLRKDRFMEICAGMKERGLAWSAAIRVDVFDEEMAAAAKEGGCSRFVVGIESFIDAKLQAMNKQITRAQIITTLELLRKYEIPYHGNVLVGLPDETYADILAELEAMPSGYNVFPMLVQPFIGTEYQSRSINDEETHRLTTIFTQYAVSKGMFVHKEAA
ncbi:radical SAM domain iron-sulfur cluster-binding oxidoreductase with cobalamin-binding-like domain [Citrifermentans bemidjiense Bem]|uniref:Radical SAM domain iron-sulfur cluster-binding oxidoreductase with cobalamin-binding-like domain n=1 Tax=Citrifermentans bemidjiense (strain ATCC BAA-1014 / DSM 16622 / JCM 12645 / Bem) TaxID=404380 RepID=B5EC25_CITBB|nr:radical SAM protein [Citrifermentans bemidjiense]ACH40481.1 radical SAM domain iron-sulfur cluster-binding oxidoreductase with cobalamin-binding-like domain [Citrifermentans bemidjiense Bem]